MSRIPVFDIGDTLMPSFRLQNELMKDEFEEYGAEEVPEFDVNNFRIYTPSEVKEYMEKNGLNDTDPSRIIEKYKQRERKYLEQHNVLSFLKKVSEEFGPIGFISDNTVEGKKWLEQLLKTYDIKYRGFVVSEQVGVEKPSPEIFEAFLDQREEDAERFVYFGNNLDRDPACRDLGMKFVLVKQFKVYGSSDERFNAVENLDFETVKEVVE